MTDASTGSSSSFFRKNETSTENRALRKPSTAVEGDGETKDLTAGDIQVPTSNAVVDPPKDKENAKNDPFAKSSFDSNPFSQFAFKKDAASLENQQKRRWVAPSEVKASPQTKKPKITKKKDVVPMNQLPAEEQERIRIKWHSLTFPHDSTTEECRFQILVACRLHARCQEPQVRKCMPRLHDAQLLTVQNMANSDAEAVALLISSLQFYNVKAQQIVEAAQQLLSVGGGMVPESAVDLIKLKGVGPVMADIMAHINTRASFESSTHRASGEP